MNTKELICIPSPRYLVEFDETLDKLRYDKYIVKYQTEPVAYYKIRDFFLSMNYETMILFADDLLVYKENLDELLYYQKHHPQVVISGICNFDAWNNKDKYCFRLEGDIGEYPRINYALCEKYFVKYDAKKLRVDPGIYRVEFNAFACMVLSREIVEQVPFRFDRPEGGGVDQNFCDDCRSKGIPVLVDINVNLHHLGGRKQGKLENFYVGKLPAKESWIKEEDRLLT